MDRGTCTCFGVELTPESMPGWPISKKEIKDPVPSTNDGWGSGEGGRFFLLYFPLAFLPPSVPLLLSNFVCQLGVHSKTLSEYPMRITRLEAVGFQGLYVPMCVSVCVCGHVCVCVCVSHLFVEQKCPSVSLDRHLAVSHWP